MIAWEQSFLGKNCFPWPDEHFPPSKLFSSCLDFKNYFENWIKCTVIRTKNGTILGKHTWIILVKCAHRDSISGFGRFCSPCVFSAYYTPFSKSRRFLTLINVFLHLRHKKAWDGKKWEWITYRLFFFITLLASNMLQWDF